MIRGWVIYSFSGFLSVLSDLCGYNNAFAETALPPIYSFSLRPEFTRHSLGDGGRPLR